MDNQGSASRVLEYIPVKLKGKAIKSYLRQYVYDTKGFQLFGFFSGHDYYTNARELLNWGWSWDEVIEVVDFTNYKAVKVTAPYFLYGQASTHTQITSVSHSNRYSDAGLGYWIPNEAKKILKCSQDEWNYIVESFPPNILKSQMRDKLGIARREVYARGADMLQYRVFCLGGYTNNPNAWEHFINQRLHDPHTQKEMRDLAELISKAIYNE